MSQDFVALLGTKGGPAIRPGSSMPTSNLICLNVRQFAVDCGLGWDGPFFVGRGGTRIDL